MFFLTQKHQPKLPFYQHNLRYIRLLEITSSFMFLIPVWVSFELRFLSLAEIAVIEAAIAATQLALELPTGALADLLGRKTTVTLGYLLDGIGYLLFTQAHDFWSFMIFSMCFGIGEALISGAKEALTFDTLKQSHQERTFPKLMNWLQIRFYWGMALSTLIGGVVYQFNIYLPAILTGLAYLVAAFWASQLQEPNIDSEKFTLRNYLKQTKEGFGELFKNSRARHISFYYILLAVVSWPMVISLKNISMTAVGLSTFQIGVILPVLNLLNVYLFRFMLNKKLFENLSQVFLFLAIVPSITWLALALNFSVVSVVLVVFMLSFISSCRWNVIGKLSNLCFASKNRATAISTLSMLIALSYTGIMLVFSWLSQKSGMPFLWISLFMAALGFVFLLPLALRLRKKLKHKEIDFELQVAPEIERSLEQQQP